MTTSKTMKTFTGSTTNNGHNCKYKAWYFTTPTDNYPNSTHGNSNTRSVFALWPTDNFTGEWVLNFSWRDGYLRCNSQECVKNWAEAISGQDNQANVCASSRQSYNGENAIPIRNKLLSQGIGWVSLQPWWCNINETDISIRSARSS